MAAAWLFFLLLAACGGGAPPSGPAPDSAVIVRGNGGEPGSLDPALAEDIHAFNVLADLYEGLVATDAAGRLVPAVASAWTISDDGRRYVFTLREDARWSNGDPVEAGDFVRAFRRVADPETASAYAFLFEPLENFTAVAAGERPPEDLGVAAPDAHTLVVTLSRPAGQLLSVLAMPLAYPLHPRAARSVDAGDPGSFIGNGPFVLRSRDFMGPIRLARNPLYRESASVAIDEVVYLPVVDEAAELNMYRSGELDITHTIPPEALPALRETHAGELRIAPMLALYYLALDLGEPPLNNPALRAALSLAIDRKRIVEVTGRGEAPAYALVPPGVHAYAGPSYDWRTLDDAARLERARALYRDAGYGPDRPLALSYVYDAGGVHEQIALAIVDMWENALGVEVELDRREWQYFLETRDRRDEWDVMRFSWFGDYDDPLTFLDLFRADSPQNLPAYSSEVYDRQLAEAVATVDAGERARLFAQAEATLLADHPLIPLYFYVSKHLVAPRVDGFEDNVLDRHPSRYLRLDPANGRTTPGGG